MKKRIIVVLSLFLFLTFNYKTLADVSQADIQRYSAYYTNGVQYLNNNQYSSAILEFKKVLRFLPYDTTTQTSIANAYYARAQYYKQQTREFKKALTDYKSALFYAKYWKNEQNQTLNQLANNAQREINDLEKKLNVPTSEAERLRNAKILKAQGELAASGYDFKQLTNTSQKNVAYKNLGNIYKNLNNKLMAMDMFKVAIDLNPTSPELHFLYGVMLDEASNFEASMEQYNLALKYGDKSPELLEILENKWTQNIVNNPNDAQSYVNLGAIYQKQGNYIEAKNQYQKAYQLDSSDETILYNLASLYSQQKDYNNALNVYNQILAKNPKNVEVLNYKADILKAQSKFDEALSQYETILSINPNDKSAKENSEDIIYNRFTGVKLQNYLASKANQNPNDYEAQFNYALELHKNKNLDSAITYYKKAIQANPSKEESYINLAQIYIDKKDYENANSICQQALIVMPNNQKISQYVKDIKEYSVSNQYEAATKLFEAKDYKGAIAEYNKISSQTKEVKLAIASCYWQLEDYKNANKYYLEILSSEPNNQEVLESSAWAYYQMNDVDNAKKTASKLLSLNKNNKEMANLLATIEENEYGNLINVAVEQYEKGNINDALNQFNKVLAKKPNDEYSMYYRALCLDELKKTSDAIKQYKALLAKNPNFKDAYYSLAVDLDNSENYKEAVANYEKYVQLKNQAGEKDELSDFANSRIKELKEYLASLK